MPPENISLIKRKFMITDFSMAHGFA